jgi:hypothetical protein
MDAYIYCADIYCDDCARAIRIDCAEDSGDSDGYPQGPYSDGGGEADGPQCCGACGEFLENPLTGDGYQYLLELLATYISPDDSQILEELGEYEVAGMVRDRALDDARAARESPDLFDTAEQCERVAKSRETMAQWADYYPEAFGKESTI